MSRYRAFDGEGTRQALVADVAARGPIHAAWLTRASIESDISPLCEEFGLHPAFARLLPVLGAFGECEDAGPFYEALLNAIPAGADTGVLARQTLLLAWTHPSYGQSRTVTQGAVRDACEAVVALVRRSIDGPVDKHAWRAARRTLARVRDEEEGAERVTDMMLSLAWDLETAPGAAHDVMAAWTSLVDAEAEARDEDCFSDAENEAFRTAMDRINAEVVQGFMDERPGEDFGYDDFLVEVEKCWMADPVSRNLKSRSTARRARTNARMAQWRATIQTDLIDRARRLPAERKPRKSGTRLAASADELL